MKETSLTDSVARLYRSGSEYSQSTEKLRAAADRFLQWIKENIHDFPLPMGCKLYASGEFVQFKIPPGVELTNALTCGSPQVFKITIGQKHTRWQLFQFSELISTGFLDQLVAKLTDESFRFTATSQKVDFFVHTAST